VQGIELRRESPLTNLLLLNGLGELTPESQVNLRKKEKFSEVRWDSRGREGIWWFYDGDVVHEDVKVPAPLDQVLTNPHRDHLSLGDELRGIKLSNNRLRGGGEIKNNNEKVEMHVETKKQKQQ